MMTLINSLPSAESIAISFLDTSRFNLTPKLPGGFGLRKRNQGRDFGKGVKCSVKVQHQYSPPLAWPERDVPEALRQSWDGPKPISLVGSTGSIGTQTLNIVAENPDKFRVVALAAGSNVTLLADQVRRFKPALVALGSLRYR